MIIAKNISKSYGDFHVLRDIDIELNSGEVTILFGPSGAGKTTLLRNLSLLDFPDKGTLEIFDKKYDFPVKRKEKIQFPYPELTVVFQQLFLWPNLRNSENILLAIRKNQSDYDDRVRYYNYLVKEMEMSGYIDKYPNQSSSGQKQRVAIARALILNPKFILFDEITASLDVLQVNHILEMILSLKKQDMGFLFITHNIDVAKRLGDKLVFMQDGKIVEVGGKEIITKSKTKELSQFLNPY